MQVIGEYVFHIVDEERSRVVLTPIASVAPSEVNCAATLSAGSLTVFGEGMKIDEIDDNSQGSTHGY